MALSSAVIEQSTSKVFSFISTKVEDKASRADTIARLEIALFRLDIALEKTRRIPITLVSLLRCRKVLKRVYMEGVELLKEHQKPQDENNAHVVVRSSSYLRRIADRAGNFSISSLVGMGKERLSFWDARKFERYADWAEKFVAEVEFGCPLRQDTFRYPFLRHLLQGRSLMCQIVKNPSQSLCLDLHPKIVEGRGVEVTLRYKYNDLRKLEERFLLKLILRISEETDIMKISIKCIQWLTSQFNFVAESAIGELTLLPNLQDTFLHPPSFVNECQSDTDFFESYVPSVTFKYDGGGEVQPCFYSELFRPDPICCNGTLANKSSMEIPEPVIFISFSCNVSAPKNSLRNAPLSLKGLFMPHLSSSVERHIHINYGGKHEYIKGGSVQQLEEKARSDAIDYLVHEPEPTDYALWWWSTHGVAIVTLEQAKLSPGRPGRTRVSKRKR